MTVPARVPSGEPAREYPFKLRFEDDSGVVAIYESSTTRDGEPLVSIACRGRGARLDRREALQLHEWLYEWLAAVSVPAQEQEPGGGEQGSPGGGRSLVVYHATPVDCLLSELLIMFDAPWVPSTIKEARSHIRGALDAWAGEQSFRAYAVQPVTGTDERAADTSRPTTATRAPGSLQDPLSVPLVEPPHEKEEGRMRVPSLELAIDALWLAGRPATGDALRAEVKSLIAERDRLLAPPMEEVSEGESSNTAVQPRAVQSTADRVPWTSRPASDLARVPKGDSPSLTSPLLVPHDPEVAELLEEWLFFGDLPTGGYGGTLAARTRAVLSRLAGDTSERPVSEAAAGASSSSGGGA